MIKKFLSFLILFFVVCGVFGFNYQDYVDINSEKYPDANAVLLYDYNKISYNSDGGSLETDDYYIKVLTVQGVVDNRTIPIFFNTFYTDVDVSALEIIKSDGKVQKIDVKKHSEIVSDSSQISQNIYDPANKILKISLPMLEVNDIIHICVKENNRISRIKNVYSFIKVLQSDMPVIYYELVVEGPKNCPLKKTLVKDEVKSTVTFTEKNVEDKIVYTWIARNVPMQIPEPDSPPMYLFSQRVLGSTAENWEEISRWYYNLCQSHLEKVTPEIHQKVAELTQNCKSDMEKIYAIFQFVSQEIRYMGLTSETEAPGYEPHDVNITFHNRYGVCRDKAALLVAMFNLAGFESYPVLFYAGYPKDSEVANNYFNHAITAVKLNGKYILMDSTDETTKELLPAYLANNSFLVAHKDGETLQLSDSIPSSDNQLAIVNNAVYNSNENILKVQSKLTFGGINDIIYRNALSRWPKGYEEQYFSMILRKINSGVTLKKVEVFPKDIRDMNQVLEIVLTYDIKNYLDTSAENLQLLPEIDLFEYIGATNMILGNMSLDERKFPMELFSTAETIEKTFIDFGNLNIAKLSLPKNSEFNNDLLEFKKNAVKNGNKLEIDSKFALKKNLIYPAQYKEIKDNIKLIEADRENIIFLEIAPKNSVYDTRVIKDITIYNFQDDYNWEKIAEREFEVLNYASMKDNAELQIYFNPAYESVELISAYVKNGDHIQQISPNEINIMDQNINAPAYSIGKIYTVNFPNVQVGSKVYYKLKVEAKNHPYFASQEIFGSFDYIESKQVEFHNVGKNFKLLYADLPDNIKIEKTDNKVIINGKNLVAKLPEIGMAPNYLFFPTVWASTGNISKFAEEVNQKIQEKAVVTCKVKKLTLEITADKKSLLEKIQTIRDYVALNIRKVNIKFSDYPLEFSTPDEVLSRAYATSADRAILLLAMLKAIEADNGCHIWLLSTLPHIDNCKNFHQEILTESFTEVLLFKENQYILNHSNQYGLLYELPLENCCYLDCSDKTIKSYNAANLADRKRNYKITVNEDNSGVIEAVFVYKGAYFGLMNERYQTATKEEKRRLFKDMATEISLRAEIIESSFMPDWQKGEVIIKLKLQVPNLVRKSGEYAYFELPDFKILGDFIRLGAESRDSDYYLKQVNAFTETYEIKLPDNSILLNQAQEICYDSDRFNYIYNYMYNDEKSILKIKNYVYAVESILDMEDYQKLLNLNNKGDRKIQKTVIFTKNLRKNLQ